MEAVFKEHTAALSLYIDTYLCIEKYTCTNTDLPPDLLIYIPKHIGTYVHTGGGAAEGINIGFNIGSKVVKVHSCRKFEGPKQ